MEHRDQARRRALKGGEIVFNRENSVISCVMRDLSEAGARLAVGSTVGIPDHFTLILNDKSKSWECSVKWRSIDTIGVHFEH